MYNDFMKASCLIAVFLIIACFFIFNQDREVRKNYHSEAYDYLELTFSSNNKEIHRKYDVMLMDNFVTKDEFEYFKAEVLKLYPHLKPYVDMHDGKKKNNWLEE